MEYFDALNIETIPRERNSAADRLEVVASTLQPSDEMLNGDYTLEINYRPLVLDNMNHWQVFKDDEHILEFIHNIEEFSNFNINKQEEGKQY